MSIGQGMTFAELIVKNGWEWNLAAGGEAIVRKRGHTPINLHADGTVSAHILGPLPMGLAALAKVWQLNDEIIEFDDDKSQSVIAMEVDQPLDIEALASSVYSADDSIPNLSCIAFVLTHGCRRILISSDSQAETLITSIEEDFDGRLEVDVATLPHHGSRRNMSTELAKRIKSLTWTISTNGGGRHLFPHAESIAHIIAHRTPKEHLCIVFNSSHHDTLIWNDQRAKDDYCYSTVYPKIDSEWVQLSLKNREYFSHF